MQLIVASKNPVKIQSALSAFQQLFPESPAEALGIHVPSGVSDQPIGDEETYQGALNRALGAQKAEPEADFWFGIEGGVARSGTRLEAFAWVVALSAKGQGEARTASFFLPPAVADLVEQGHELGHADDIVFGASNSKQKSGAVGLLTGDVMTRLSLYTPAVILAMVPFKNQHLYFQQA